MDNAPYSPVVDSVSTSFTSYSAYVVVPSSSGDLVLRVLGCETCTSVSLTFPAVQRWNVLAGSGTFVTGWDYYANDQAWKQWYTGGASGEQGELVEYAYLSQGALKELHGATAGYYYVQQAQYDAAGRRVQSVVNGVTTAFVGQYLEWTGSTSTMKKYFYFGAQRVAVRDGSGTGTTGLSWLLTDHLGSTTISLDAAGTKNAEKRYRPWGEERFSSGTLPTQYTYTGQYRDSYINLLWYGSRWYDSELGRFVQPDSIVPGVGEGGNPNAVGYLGASTYTPLIVDFHETQFLEQVNRENRARLDNPNFEFPLVPTNPIAFDRYAYSLNNSVRYNDPTGHCPQCFALVATLGAITPLGWVAIGVTTAAVVVYFAVPGVREAVTEGMYQAGQAASNGLNFVFASKYRNDPRTAGEIIAANKQGRIKGEFPSEMLGKTYDEIVELAKHASGAVQKAAQTAKKLLDSKEYDKKQKR